MFIMTITWNGFPVEIPVKKIFSKGSLAKIYGMDKYLFKEKKYLLKEYFDIYESPVTDEIIDIKYLHHLSFNKKCLAFLLLDSLIKEYKMNLAGLCFEFDIHPNLRNKFGEDYEERVGLKAGNSIHLFNPKKDKVQLEIGFDLFKKLNWYHNHKKPEVILEKYLISLDMRDISGFVFK